MAERILRIVTESTWGMPEECKPKNTDVVRTNDGKYHCRYLVLNDEGRRERRKVGIDEAQIISVLQRLKMASIPAVPSFEMGCDGGFTELHVGGYSGKVSYRWWSEPPKGWEELDKIASEVLSWRGRNTSDL